MSAAEVAAIKARIVSGGVAAHDAQPSSPTYPYAIIYADSGVGTADRESGAMSVRSIGWQTTTVGVSAAQCRAAADRVTASLEGWRPTVAGRSLSRVAHEASQPVRADEDLPDRTLFIATDQWRVVSEPSA